MTFVISVCRIVLPVLAFIILFKCFLTLLGGHPVNKTYGYIVKESTGEKIALNTWETSIGRSKSCDIVLPENMVSRFHSVICRRVDGWYIFDTVSKGGTFVNGEKVEKGTPINSNDKITFAGENYFFVITDDPVIKVGRKGRKNKKDPAPLPPVSETVTDTEDSKTLRADTAPKQSALIGVSDRSVYLLCGRSVNVGRGGVNDIKLKAPSSSRNHAVLVNQRGGWYLNDTSSNGTFINGVKAKSVERLKDGDIIAFGTEKMKFIADYKS